MLKSLIDFAIERRVTIVMFTVAIALFGFVSLSRLKLNLLPDLSYPTITIRTELPGAAPLELETLITRPVEEVRQHHPQRPRGALGLARGPVRRDARVPLGHRHGHRGHRRPREARPAAAADRGQAAPAAALRPGERTRHAPRADGRRRRDRRRQHRAAQGAAPLRRGPPEARPRSGRGLGGGQGERRLRGRSAGLRRPAEARAAGTLDRRRHAPHPRREREPVRRPARAGHAALPGAHAERVRERRADGERDHRHQGRPARLPARRRATSRAATRTARRSRASTARSRSSSPSTRKATRTPWRSPTACVPASRNSRRTCPRAPSCSRSTTSPRSSPRRSAR